MCAPDNKLKPSRFPYRAPEIPDCRAFSAGRLMTSPLNRGKAIQTTTGEKHEQSTRRERPAPAVRPAEIAVSDGVRAGHRNHLGLFQSARHGMLQPGPAEGHPRA